MKNIAVRCLVAASLAAVILLFDTSCTSVPKMTDVFTAPDLTRLHFNKIMAIAPIKDEATRRAVEEAIVANISGTAALPSYAFFVKASDIADPTKVTKDIKEAGFDGVIVVRPLSAETQTSVNYDYPAVSVGVGVGYPGAYGSFGSYYGGYAMSGYDVSVTVDHIVSVEVSLYEFPTERLLWLGYTKSTSPGGIKGLIDGVAASVRKHMTQQKLIAPQAN